MMSNFRAQCADDECKNVFNYFCARGDFCRLPISFANSLNPDQDRFKIGSDLDLNLLTI